MIFSLIFIGIGALVLVITSFRIDVEPADANQLNINEDQAPLFLKNAVLQYTDSTATNNLYKPYSLFGEQLSHISEEDASMLRRMTSNAASSLYRQTSISSTHSAMSNTTTTGAYNNLAYDDLAAEHGPYTRMSRTVVSSMEVAMLPLPSPTMPMIALVLLFIPSISLPDESLQWTTTTLTGWKNMSLLINMMLLGMARSMVNTFLLIFLYDTVHIPMYQIGIMIIIPVAIDILLRASAQQWIYRWSLTTVTSFIHSLLIISIFGFSWLRQDSIGTQIAMVLLQTGQGIGMHLIWLTASNRIMAWMRTDQQLMLQRAKMSALYSSLGPAFGALIAGFVMHAHDAHFREGFTFLCQCAIGMLAGSYVLSWGWTFDA
ncbi:uncharacterized protein BYT42DRAFT_503963 [Radiomyces spectabilis]|uniref:uncharacterized protein n=1 Tax=Radiomyces spectabilis TaxID=64574 RepID=UPI00221F6F02|nr:uncharacterized protein BYT42DRAFT_503963 [Radiomyces spectabilis]KAI8368241.1 hypothetical protein BYT42DRAFT_503963 [Radiomyces spectabilis]